MLKTSDPRAARDTSRLWRVFPERQERSIEERTYASPVKVADLDDAYSLRPLKRRELLGGHFIPRERHVLIHEHGQLELMVEQATAQERIERMQI
jgi:hypothetical protein